MMYAELSAKLSSMGRISDWARAGGAAATLHSTTHRSLLYSGSARELCLDLHILPCHALQTISGTPSRNVRPTILMAQYSTCTHVAISGLRRIMHHASLYARPCPLELELKLGYLRNGSSLLQVHHSLLFCLSALSQLFVTTVMDGLFELGAIQSDIL
jgi:hypothetical protein